MKEVNRENEFERLLKEKADRFEMKPSPGVWQQVQETVLKDRRRRFGWWLMAALLFAVMGTGAFFILQKKSYPPEAPATVENNSGRSGINNTEENRASGSNNDNTSEAQKQSADNTLPKNHTEKISGEKNVNESHSVPLLAGSESPEVVQMLTPSEAVQHDDNMSALLENEPVEFIAPLSLKQFTLSLPEASIHELTLEKSSFDFSSLSSKHSFYFEADAMALNNFVRSHTTSSSILTIYLTPTLQENYSSYSLTKGFSTGGNFIFEQNNKWLFGIGLHFTKTHLEAITAQQTVPVYDASYIYTGDTIVYQSRSDINQWFDVSLITGVKLFPFSKNHIRILAGGGYSRLLADISSHLVTPTSYNALFDSIPLGSSSVNGATPVFVYRKNQLQLFSEIAYQRELAPQLSFTAGMQFHYYPMNLLNSTELSQRMMWVGLKGGLLFRF